MKKLYLIACMSSALISQQVTAQQEFNFGDFPKPVPSVSSLATYNNAPISNATGLPEIAVPLLGLPAKDVNLNMSLSYNPMNVADTEPVSQLGTGWTLFAGGVISRSIVDDIDEMYDNTNYNGYFQNAFDDIYYYNLPGISGRFKMVRDQTNNTFKLVNLTVNKVKIEYTRENTNATLIFNSFTITDAKGIKYIFNDYSRSNREQNVYTVGAKIYKSAFFLTEIKDANNTVLASFTYQKNIKYKNNGTTIAYETCKLKTISSPGFGKIELEYLYFPGLENSMTDPYQLQNVILKDSYNHMISGYSFHYRDVTKRQLIELKKLNKNNVVTEITKFEYGDAVGTANGSNPNLICPGLFAGSPQLGMYGILKRIITPSGGVTEYNFEQNQRYIDRTEPSYLDNILGGNVFVDPEIQYMNTFLNFDYDTHQSNNTTSTFTITGNDYKRIFVLFVAEELYTDSPVWDPGTPYSMGYAIKTGNEVVLGNPCSSPNFNGNYYVTEYNLYPGTYTLQVGGSGGKGGVYFYEIAHIPQPFKNTTPDTGVRIASIKNYNNIMDANPVKTIKYEYSSFADSTMSSGHSVISDADENAQSYIIYKNVKVSNSDDGNGYVKYYYKTPDDYPTEPYNVNGINGVFWPYYNMTSSGLLHKKEIYDSQNKLLASEQTDYTFDPVPGAEDYMNGTGYTRLGWLKKTVNTSTAYFGAGQSTEEQSETNFNVFNFGIASTKKILDGNMVEQFYTYPESGYSQLSNAHILDIPVMVEEKNDGKTVSKAETKFDNAASIFPTSVVAFNVSDSTTKLAKKMDLYDARGNVIQFTSEADIPTVVVYGYDQTLPIARIEGVTYAQISSFVQPIIDASNADAANPANETAFLAALDTFRKNPALQNAQVTTYTYDPLIGVTTTTAPNGMREIYQYNINNQLEKIINKDGVTLKEYQYHYKN